MNTVLSHLSGDRELRNLIVANHLTASQSEKRITDNALVVN